MAWKNKAVAKAWQHKHYLENKEKILKKTNEYRQNHKEHIKQKAKEYGIRNRDLILQKKKDYYQRNKNTTFKAYAERNKVRISKFRKLRYIKNKERENIIHKQWYQRNRKSEIESALVREKKKWAENPEKMKKEHKEQYEKHKPKRLAAMKEYLKNPEKWAQHKKSCALYYQNHPEKMLVYNINQLKRMALPFRLPFRQYEYALQSWTKTVRKMCGEFCSICGSTNRLNSHHILHKAKYPKLSLNPNNGIPLCFIHHKEVHGWR